ncbi:hypothetical protein LJ737_26440 [Hymenobacter sp. 15J16-1T3B]|uniref:hypothetical protein n=1 Tax=Hymenobacter sp. 15J16-1T3B TaxID=2886941 RepID=UPI001D108056|nr:hypothetical protein [Hymenobacter sp. 15J16-1T3B]MCC3160804.1 hypothetical protein [Hymenobacter sp. 15J16-1T3B]
MNWHFIGSCLDGETFRIGGLDVWQHPWTAQPQTARVIDPHYGVAKQFNVYRLGPPEAPVLFAAGEFSNGVWGFYAPAAADAAP